MSASRHFRNSAGHGRLPSRHRREHGAQQRTFHGAQTTLQGAACHRDRAAGQREERMRGRAAGQPLNRVFEPSLSPGSHAGAAFSADGQLFTTSSLLQCDRPELQQLLLRAQAAQKSSRDLIEHCGQRHGSVAVAHGSVVVLRAADVDNKTNELVGLTEAPTRLLHVPLRTRLALLRVMERLRQGRRTDALRRGRAGARIGRAWAEASASRLRRRLPFACTALA